MKFGGLGIAQGYRAHAFMCFAPSVIPTSTWLKIIFCWVMEFYSKKFYYWGWRASIAGRLFTFHETNLGLILCIPNGLLNTIGRVSFTFLSVPQIKKFIIYNIKIELLNFKLNIKYIWKWVDKGTIVDRNKCDFNYILCRVVSSKDWLATCS